MEKEEIAQPVLLALTFALALFRFDILLAVLLLYIIFVVKNKKLIKESLNAVALMILYHASLYLAKLGFQGLDLLLELFKEGIDLSIFTTLDRIESFVTYGITIYFVYVFFTCIKNVIQEKEYNIPIIGPTLKKYNI